MILRHPRQRTLAAWYDLETDDPRLTAHIGGCTRCATVVQRFAAVDAAVTASEGLALMPHHPVDHARVGRPTAARGAFASIALVVALVATMPAYGSTTRLVANVFGLGDRDITAAGSSVAGPAPERAAGGATAARVRMPVAARTGQAPRRGAEQGLTPRAEPLRLGTVVPMTGSDAAAAADIVRAVRAAVDDANAAGGVNGHAVELQIVAAEAMATTDLSRLSAFVGGSAAPDDAPWLLPSDPSDAPARAVAADPTPVVAGRLLGDALAARNPEALVGIVQVDSGREAGLGEGIRAANRAVVADAGADSDCGDEIVALRAQGATALAIAAPAGLVARCLNAAAYQRWRPADGVFVPPVVAYAQVADFAPADGAQTVLGLPAPTSHDPGARRFRARTGSRSYAAQVAFAATELAVEVARANGAVTLDDIAAGTWSNDLYVYAGTTVAAARIVQARAGKWEPVSTR